MSLIVDGTTGLTLPGSSSGTTVLQAAASASGTLTLPATTDTLVGKATTDTLTNKTLTAAALGSSTATTQTAGDNSTKVATTAYADRVGVQQVVSTITGAVATGTTTIPNDNTIPQNTEGDQYMSLAITPKSATSKLEITVTFMGSTNNAAAVVFNVVLFQDTTANALAVAASTSIGANNPQAISFKYTMTSGTTSSTTFKVRAGSNSAGTTTFNGTSGGQLYGGAYVSSIVIEEIGI